MVHANAVLTPRGRLLLARRVVDEGWPIARGAEHFHVSWPTAKRWASRYAAMGPAGMTDRSKPTASLSEAHTATDRAQDRAFAMAPPAVPVGDRVAVVDADLHGARGAGAVSIEPVVAC